MNSKRIKEIQEATVYPKSLGVQQALLQVWNECEQDSTIQWVSVKNRFPSRRETVLFCTDMGYVSQGYYVGAWIETFIGTEYTNVTHWMPLPEQPKV